MSDNPALNSFPAGSSAIVIGGTGGIGAAVVDHLTQSSQFQTVLSLGRSTSPALDLGDEASIAAAAGHAKSSLSEIRLIFDATGFLHGNGIEPEKTWRNLSMEQMQHLFAINAAGPALVMKHFLPLLPREGKAVFATISAKVGSIGDNQIGGWYSYRASKAALNQFVRCAAIELRRKSPEAICVALHPGTVDTGLSKKFQKGVPKLLTPAQSAGALLSVLDGLGPEQSGEFFAYSGEQLPW